ncbi:Imm26 family immunity protein [Flavobacterium sp. UGB4466]|uniref:Imm26 family immunity protein n=1 Tax=Flavobacterium sp. UGB4466 TaxID=2730889 RepID=UPI00192B8427|nr:Imm26 family immunity protein [Flavobacterium sp. UGB4466]
MKKNKIETGSIIKISLEHGFGFVLAKFINLKEIKEDIGYNEFIYVYNRVFKDEDIIIDDIDNNDLLLGGIYVLNPYPALKNKIWEIVGVLEPKETELKIPDFKDFGPLLASYEKDAKIWYCIHNAEVNNRMVVDYDKIKHLELFVYRAYGSIIVRLTMEVIRQNNKQIEDYYDLKEHDDLASYYNTIYTPIYSSIPKEIRGKAIL